DLAQVVEVLAQVGGGAVGGQGVAHEQHHQGHDGDQADHGQQGGHLGQQVVGAGDGAGEDQGEDVLAAVGAEQLGPGGGREQQQQAGDDAQVLGVGEELVGGLGEQH